MGADSGATQTPLALAATSQYTSCVGWMVLQRGWSALHGLAGRVADLFYPGVCAGCDALCDSGGMLCQPCAQKLSQQQQAPACEKCAMPLPQHDAPCPWCLGNGRNPYQRILRLGVFEDPLRKLIHRLKYQSRWTLAEALARQLRDHDAVRNILADAQRIVPVPLHWWRQFRRGYNQAEVMARELARHSPGQVVRAARRLRDTPSQTRFRSIKARRENVRGAFELLSPKAIEGQRVVVVDDVMTSGATLIELGRVLAAAGPARLDALVLGIADPRGSAFQRI